jgi:hypothetical protein
MRKGLAFLFIFLLLGFSVALWAQSDRGAIKGTVTDPTGAVVPGVEVVAVNLNTGVRTTAPSNEVGLYSILNLPVGTYSITFSREGFKKFDRTGIQLAVAQVIQLDVVLQMGSTSEHVTVTGDVPMLQTATSEVGTNLKSSVVQDLPLSGGSRQMEMFAYKITPSVQGDYWQSVIAGGQTFSKEVTIDGTSATAQIQGATFAAAPILDAIDEMTVQTSGSRAENGRSGGGVFIMTLKSGTNQFHGSAFGFAHNEITDASPWGGRKDKNRNWDYGFAAGGPIIKNKTFIFGAYERVWSRDFRLQPPWATVPTTDFLNGDFSRLLDTSTVLGTDPDGNTIYQGAIFDPATPADPDTGLHSVFVGNIIPSNRFSSVANQIVDIFRTNYAPVNDNLIYNNSLPLSNSPSQTGNQFSIKVDQNFSDKDRMNFSWIGYRFNRTLDDSGGIWQRGSRDGGPLSQARVQHAPSNEYRINYTHSFTPNILNVLGLTYNAIGNTGDSIAPGGNWPQTLGFGDTGAYNFPQIDFGEWRNGVGTDYIGNTWKGGFKANTFLMNESLSWVKGRHSFKFGGEFRAIQINSAGATGALKFGFSPDTTGAPEQEWAKQVGFGFASFLLGDASNASQTTPFNLYGRRKYMALWIEDDFKISRKLTLNLDLRWETTFPFHEKFGHWTNFDLTATNPDLGIPGVMVYANQGSDSFESKRDWKEFAPHIGAAYQLMDKLVLRGAYGISYSPIGNQYWSGVPYGFAPGFRGTNVADSPFNWDSGYPGVFVPGTKDPNYMQWGPVNVDPRSLFAGYLHQFNIGAQYALTKDLKVDVGYVGNWGRRLTGGTLALNSADWKTRMNLNLSGHDWDYVYDEASAAAAGVPYPYSGFNGWAWAAIEPYPQVPVYTTWWYQDNPIEYVGVGKGKSDYHALQIEVVKRTGRAFNMDFSYTMSRARTNSFSNWGENWWSGGLQDYSNLDREAQNYNPWDQKHVFKGYFTYELPFGRGRRFLSVNRWLDYAVGGWNWTTLLRYGSGRPLAVYSRNWVVGSSSIYPNINSGADFNRQFDAGNFDPNFLIPDPTDPTGERMIPNPKDLYFKADIFSDPAPGQMGTALARDGRLRGFGDASEDMSLLKYFSFGDDNQYKLSIRLEMYNIFNRHGFGEPDTNMSSPTFGYVTGVSGNPRQGLLGVRFQW